MRREVHEVEQNVLREWFFWRRLMWKRLTGHNCLCRLSLQAAAPPFCRRGLTHSLYFSIYISLSLLWLAITRSAVTSQWLVLAFAAEALVISRMPQTVSGFASAKSWIAQLFMSESAVASHTSSIFLLSFSSMSSVGIVRSKRKWPISCTCCKCWPSTSWRNGWWPRWTQTTR